MDVRRAAAGDSVGSILVDVLVLVFVLIPSVYCLGEHEGVI